MILRFLSLLIADDAEHTWKDRHGDDRDRFSRFSELGHCSNNESTRHPSELSTNEAFFCETQAKQNGSQIAHWRFLMEFEFF